MKPILSIITINFNTREVTLNCLKSVIKYTKKIPYEIIVIDHGSTDGSVEALEKFADQHSQVHFINARENLGFGKGNNRCVEKSKGEYLLFLNNDTLVFDDAISQAVENLQNKPDVGVYSCRLLNSDRTIQPSGGSFISLWNLLGWQLFLDDIPLVEKLFKSFHPKHTHYTQDRHVDWVTGAFMMMPKKVFEEVGGFDDHIFMYTEEMELAYRVSKLGCKSLLTASPSIIHLGKASSNSRFALVNEAKNIRYFFEKHKSAWQIPIVNLAFILGSLFRILIFGIIKNNSDARKTYLEILRYYL